MITATMEFKQIWNKTKWLLNYKSMYGYEYKHLFEVTSNLSNFGTEGF